MEKRKIQKNILNLINLSLNVLETDWLAGIFLKPPFNLPLFSLNEECK